MRSQFRPKLGTDEALKLHHRWREIRAVLSPPMLNFPSPAPRSCSFISGAVVSSHLHWCTAKKIDEPANVRRRERQKPDSVARCRWSRVDYLSPDSEMVKFSTGAAVCVGGQRGRGRGLSWRGKERSARQRERGRESFLGLSMEHCRRSCVETAMTRPLPQPLPRASVSYIRLPPSRRRWSGV